MNRHFTEENMYSLYAYENYSVAIVYDQGKCQLTYTNNIFLPIIAAKIYLSDNAKY